MGELNYMMEPNVCLLLFAAAVTLFLLIGAVASRARSRAFMRFFIALLATTILMLVGEAGIWYFGRQPDRIPLLKLGVFLSLSCGAAVNALFAYCLIGFLRERERLSWVCAHIVAAICGAVILLAAVSLLNGMLFGFDAAGNYHDGPWYWIVEMVDLGTLLLDVGMVIYYWRVLGCRGTLSLLSFSVLPLLAMLAMPDWYPTPLYMATTLSIILIYILFHSELSLQLAKKERLLRENERQLAESRIATMLSQIQPHFIYNTLGTIEYLCKHQPQTAARLVHDFSLYLRGNFSELDNPNPILLSREMEHVRHYIDIEKVRFRDMEIRLELHSSDFLLPALSVQPLVENAVKHGLMGLASGGTITVSSYETDEQYCVSVVDDGIGFDTAVPVEADKHVGIRNIRGRLQALCGGTLTVTSSPGKGTKALITIPKEVEG